MKRAALSHSRGCLITMCQQWARMMRIGDSTIKPGGDLNHYSVSMALPYRDGMIIGCSFRERKSKPCNYFGSSGISPEWSCFRLVGKGKRKIYPATNIFKRMRNRVSVLRLSRRLPVRTTSSPAVGITTAEGSAMLGSPLLEIIFPFVQDWKQFVNITLEVDVIENCVVVSHLVFSDVGFEAAVALHRSR